MGRISAWRANDVVVYDGMRESATLLTALLTAKANSESADSELAREEAVQLRHDVLTADAYDRAGVSALADRIDERIRALSAESS